MKPLRDARLQRALESAPDADARPAALTRQSVLAAAHDAVRPAAPETWWKMWWRADREANMPWNAALATVAVATLVTTLWHDREVPGARIEKGAADQQAPMVAQPASPAVPAPAGAPRPPPVVDAAKPAAGMARRSESRARKELAAQPAPEQRAAEPPSLQGAEPTAPMRDEQVRELAKTAPAPTLSARSAAATANATASGGAAPQAAAPAATEWSHARIVTQGRSVEVSRQQAGGLAQWLARIPRNPAESGALEAPVSERLELMQASEKSNVSEVTEVIELAGDQFRWSRPRGGSGTLRPDPAVLQALRGEIARLVQR